ncbi:MAG: hypothetical protein KDB68_10615 [Planctomycetes bacterium]|nr:hypothetical protein [Planctomycetota bacterium]MCA8936639.1 hypothetical protein [Planctomycetota bacterium]
MIPLTLFLLATLDAIFVGYRDATGRSGLVRKRSYYGRAMLRGGLVGQFPIAVIGVTVTLCFLHAPDFQGLWRAFEVYGETLIWVFAPYAVIVLLAFIPRLTPSVDVRSMTNVVVFGPFTAARPFLVVAASMLAAWRAPRIETLVLTGVIILCMLSLEPALNQLWQRNWCRTE